MTNDSLNERDELIMRVVSGDLDRASDEYARAAEADPELAARVDKLLGLQSELDSSAVRDAILAQAQSQSWSEGEARARRALDDAVGSPADRGAAPVASDSRRPHLLKVAAALAAAALVLVVARSAGWFDGGPIDDPDPAPPVYLGDVLPGASPVGPGSSYAEFRWDLTVGPQWEFEIEVFSDSPGAAREPLASERTRESTWSPPAKEAAEWPDAIRWTLALVNANGVVGDAYEVRAQR